MKFSDLKFIRLTQPEQFNLVPRYLFEQIREKTDINRIYEVGMLSLTSPFVFVYVLVDKNIEEKKIKGILWLSINVLERYIYVELLSVDKEYQSKECDAIKKTLDFIRGVNFGPDMTNKVVMATLRPVKFEKAGFTRSKKLIMEINNV